MREILVPLDLKTISFLSSLPFGSSSSKTVSWPKNLDRIFLSTNNSCRVNLDAFLHNLFSQNQKNMGRSTVGWLAVDVQSKYILNIFPY